MKSFFLFISCFSFLSSLSANIGDSTIFKYNLQAQPTIILDVELRSFDALPLSNQIFLNWVTARERNNAFFTIERSKDGVSFEALAQIEGMGNSGVSIYYDFVDESPLAAYSYYRLLQSDENGTEHYGPILKVYSLQADLVQYNKQEEKKWALEFNCPEVTEVLIRLYNKKNKLVFEENRKVDQGLQLIPLQIQNLKRGQYRLELKSQKGEFQKALRIQP